MSFIKSLHKSKLFVLAAFAFATSLAFVQTVNACSPDQAGCVCDEFGQNCRDLSLNGSAPAAAPTKPATTTPDQSAMGQALNAGDLEQQCIDQTKTTKNACTSKDSKDGMSKSDLEEFGVLAATIGSNIALMIAQQQQNALLCQAASAVQMAQAGMATLKSHTCGKNVNSCNDICGQAADALKAQHDYWYDQAEAIKVSDPEGAKGFYATAKEYANRRTAANTNRNRCDGYGDNQVPMQYAAMNLQLAMTSAAGCASLNSSKATTQSASLTMPSGTDCSSGAATMQCYCQSNPTAPVCSGSSAASGVAGATSLGTGSPSSSIPYSSDSSNLAGDGSKLPDQIAAKPQSTKADPAGGGGGGGLGGGNGASGGAGGGGSGDQASANSGIDKNPIQGVANSSGGIGMSSMSAAGTGGGRGGGGAGYASKAGGGGGLFNLKKFLPGGINRGIAGMSAEAAKDGITGAMGPTLWQKLSSQYQNQQNTLFQGK